MLGLKLFYYILQKKNMSKSRRNIDDGLTIAIFKNILLYTHSLYIRCKLRAFCEFLNFENSSILQNVTKFF